MSHVLCLVAWCSLGAVPVAALIAWFARPDSAAFALSAAITVGLFALPIAAFCALCVLTIRQAIRPGTSAPTRTGVPWDPTTSAGAIEHATGTEAMDDEAIRTLFLQHFPPAGRTVTAREVRARPDIMDAWLRAFVASVVAKTPGFTELHAPSVCRALGAIDHPTWRALSHQYPLYPNQPVTGTAEREAILNDLRWRLVRAVDPPHAECLAHLARLGSEDRTWLYDCLQSNALRSPGDVPALLSGISEVISGSRPPYEDGCDDWSYSVDAQEVAFTCDGDGAFTDDEIKTIRLTPDEALTMLRSWHATIESAKV